MAQNRITLKDVAEHSGYSLRTVKKVFNDSEGVSKKARTKITASAEALNYKFDAGYFNDLNENFVVFFMA